MQPICQSHCTRMSDTAAQDSLEILSGGVICVVLELVSNQSPNLAQVILFLTNSDDFVSIEADGTIGVHGNFGSSKEYGNVYSPGASLMAGRSIKDVHLADCQLTLLKQSFIPLLTTMSSRWRRRL